MSKYTNEQTLRCWRNAIHEDVVSLLRFFDASKNKNMTEKNGLLKIDKSHKSINVVYLSL